MSKLSIANQTLRLLGVSQVINNYDSDNTPIANTIRLFFDDVYNDTLTSYNWLFCSAFNSPPLISNNKNTKVHTGGLWQNAYQRPSDALLIRKVKVKTNEVKFSVGNFLGERVIFCNEKDIIVNITEKINDFSIVPNYIKTLLTYNLALQMWHTVKGELDSDFNKLYNVKNASFEQAKKNDNEQFYKIVKQSSPWIEAR